jgi:hypothetical protein
LFVKEWKKKSVEKKRRRRERDTTPKNDHRLVFLTTVELLNCVTVAVVDAPIKFGASLLIGRILF